MKKYLVSIVMAILLAASVGATSCLAKINTDEYIKLGPPNEKYGYAQGMTADGSTLYVMDGIIIRKWDGKRFSNYFDLNSLAPALKKHGLQDEETIHSFRLSQMQMYKNELYVSGLMFLNLESKKLKYRDSLVNGHTYNVVFKVAKNKPELLLVDHAKINIGFTPFDVFETEDGRPNDLYAWGEYTLYDYAKSVTYPRFTFENGDMILVRQVFTKDEAEKTPLTEVLKLGKKTESLYSWRRLMLPGQAGDCDGLSCIKYRVPVKEGNTLSLYDGKNGIHRVNLRTKETEDLFMPEEFVMKHPYWTGSDIYFLNDDMLFRIEEDEDQLFSFYGQAAKEFDFSGDVAGYARTDDALYILNFDTRVIHKYKAG